jgi:Rod binding domain-containing protein
MNLNPISNPQSPKDVHTQKLVRAAHQFEAVLLNSLLGPLEHTFASLGKENNEPGSDNYQFLGIQTLASALAEKGGIGIADMIIRNMRRHEQGELARSAQT